jgi:hypothetical protein
LGTHGENKCGTSGAHNMSIASGNGHNIPFFFANVWKYLVSLRIALVVPLSTRQISASAIQFLQDLLNIITIKANI